MSLRREWRKARLAPGIVEYLRTPLGPGEALEEVRARAGNREANFRCVARTRIFGDSQSLHLKLLRWAGWDCARLERALAAEGLERTLVRLRDDGVRTSADEFSGRRAIYRGDVLIQAEANGSSPPSSRRAALRAVSSGTSGRPSTETSYDWSFFSEEAALECLLFDSHGLLDAPCAFWLPAPPAPSGMHNLLVHLRLRRAPERWFSHVRMRRRDTFALHYIRNVSRALGMRVPVPEPTGATDASRVADWLAAARDRTGAAVLKTFATSAVRVAEAAAAGDLDLRGCVIFAGGEPLTEKRRSFIASTGALVFGRYVATETGWIGAACPEAGARGAMHLYSDRLAVVPGDAAAGENATYSFLFTTISRHADKVLLNTDIGDAGRLRTRPCPCPLGRAGLDVEIDSVYGYDKVSGEGTTVPVGLLSTILDDLVADAGGAPDSYQLREEEDRRGGSRLVIILSPDVAIDDGELRRSALERLQANPDSRLAGVVWAENGTIDVRRAYPSLTDGMKLKRFIPLGR